MLGEMRKKTTKTNKNQARWYVNMPKTRQYHWIIWYGDGFIY